MRARHPSRPFATVVVKGSLGSIAPSRAQCEPSACFRGADQTRRSPAPALYRMSRALPAGGDAQKLARHRVDLGEICRDVVVAAALARDQMEAVARERLGQTRAAEMNYGCETMLVLRAGPHVWPVCENGGDIAV